jgi:hypothetical protein
MLNNTQYRDSNNSKGNDRKMEKREKPVQEPEGNEENRY